jgi:hypothetical protein
MPFFVFFQRSKISIFLGGSSKVPTRDFDDSASPGEVTKKVHNTTGFSRFFLILAGDLLCFQ